MTSAVAALEIAVAAISAVCYALLNRAEKIKRNRRPTSDNPTDGAGASGGDGWATAIWFGGHHSAIDSSGNPSDFSGGDTVAAIAAAETAVVGTEVAAAIDAIGRSGKHRGFDPTQQRHFRFNPKWLGGQFGIA